MNIPALVKLVKKGHDCPNEQDELMNAKHDSE